MSSSNFGDGPLVESPGRHAATSTIRDLLGDAGASAREIDTVAASLDLTLDRLRHATEITRSETEALASASREIAEASVEALDRLDTRVSITGQAFTRVNDAVAQLTRFVGSVRRISDQTKLLSLNARIEAARAGDAGTGFAVVADEIGRLAAEAGTESQAITAPIQGLTAAAEESAALVAETSAEVRGLTERIRASIRGGVDGANAAADGLAEVSSRLLDVGTANRQQRTTAARLSADIAEIESVISDTSGQASPGADVRSRLELARARGALRIGMSDGFLGACFRSASGELVGLEVAIAQAVADRLGLKAALVETPWVDLPKRLRRDAIDVAIQGMVPSVAYKGIRFTTSYLDTGLVVVKRAADKSVSSTEHLAGKTVAIIADPAARAAVASGLPGAEIREIFDDDFYEPVIRGTYDALVIDQVLVHWAINDPESPYFQQLEIVGKPITKWIYSAALAGDRRSDELYDLIDAAIVDLRGSREYQKIVDRWHGTTYRWNLTPEQHMAAERSPAG